MSNLRDIRDASALHPAEVIDREQPQPSPVESLAQVLSVLLEYIAKGYKGGTDDMRVWVFLREVRPDLIGGESLREYALRRGVSAKRVQDLVNEFRATIPLYRSASRRSFASFAHEAPPPGARNLFPEGNSPGSARGGAFSHENGGESGNARHGAA